MTICFMFAYVLAEVGSSEAGVIGAVMAFAGGVIALVLKYSSDRDRDHAKERQLWQVTAEKQTQAMSLLSRNVEHCVDLLRLHVTGRSDGRDVR